MVKSIMVPEILVAHVLLAMCGDRLDVVVYDDGGDAGPFLLGTAVEGEPVDLVRDLLLAVDPAMVLLALAGWRTIAIEVRNTAVAERIEVLTSSFSRPAGSAGTDTMSWSVAVLRGDGGALRAGAWEIALELTRQPLLELGQELPLEGLAGVTRTDLWGKRVTLSVPWTKDTSAFSADRAYELLVTEPGGLVEGVAALLAEAAGRFDTRWENIRATDTLPAPTGLLGAFAPLRWELRTEASIAALATTLAGRMTRVSTWLSDQLLGPGIGLPERTAFFVDQARRIAAIVPASQAELDTACDDPTGELSDGVYNAWLLARPLLVEVCREDDGVAWASWFGARATTLGAWFRLHNEGVLDLMQAVSADLRAAAEAFIASDSELSADQAYNLMACVRRFPSDPQTPTAAELVLGLGDFGGFWVTGLVGTSEGVAQQVEATVATLPLFWGTWHVVVAPVSDVDVPGHFNLLLMPGPDVAPLSQALWEWTFEEGYRPAERLSARRRDALAAALPAATVIEERRLGSNRAYTDVPTPAAMLDAIDYPLAPVQTGAGVLIGHPDTGLLSPVHSGVAARAVYLPGVTWQADADSAWRADFPEHGTSTASALCGSGVFKGVDPYHSDGPEVVMTYRGVAPEASFAPYHVGWTVMLLTHDFTFGRAGESGTVGKLAEALRHFAALPEAERPGVISISLGYKFDVFGGATGAVLYGSRYRFLPAALLLSDQQTALADLEAACQEAYDAHIIVCAAGAQLKWGLGWIGGPAYPAAFSTVVGCGGLYPDGTPWPDAFAGSGIDVAVSCYAAWACKWESTDDISRENERIKQSEGTSYSTAFVAGTAALWLERYRDDLVGLNPADIFLHRVLPNCGLEPVRYEDGSLAAGYGHGRLSVTKVLDYDWR